MATNIDATILRPHPHKTSDSIRFWFGVDHEMPVCLYCAKRFDVPSELGTWNSTKFCTRDCAYLYPIFGPR